jgi:hypothetical protein
MELSAELLQSTLSHLKGDQVDKRKHPRAPLRFRLKMIPYEDGALGQPVEVWTRDISAGGLGITYSKPLRLDRKFIVRLPQMDDVPVYLLCTVRNCTEVAKNVYRIGASFAEVLGRSGPIASALNAGEQPPAKQQGQPADELRRISEAILS